MESIPLLDAAEAWRRLRQARDPMASPYFAMYSSLLGGVVTDPGLMVVPVDDHLVHRGDGVFETCKVVEGAVYNLAAHLRRLRHSASMIGLARIPTDEEMTWIVRRTAAASERSHCHIRILLGRGPGSFGANPYDCPEPTCYVVAYVSPGGGPQSYPDGATAADSAISAKPAPFARIKSCNYLPNALMKKEAADLGVDFVLGFDAAGHLAECATESVALVDASRRLLVPEPHSILDGTTLQRVEALAQTQPREAGIQGVVKGPIPREAVRTAAEILIIGTTMNVISVTRYAGRPVGSGRPGAVAAALRSLLEKDIAGNPALRTPICE
jgi:branched-chain amino acid aminotransferase